MKIDHLTGPRKRKGLGAILSVIILMAMISTVLLAYILLVTNGDFLSTQASQSRQYNAQVASQEELSLRAFHVASGPHNNWVYFEAYNSGNVPATITAVYVTDSSGSIKSTQQPPGTSPYLVGMTDLNVSLPLTIPVSTNTTTMSGCASGIGCNIGINPLAYSYVAGSTIHIDVLTSTGKVFTAQYPPPSGSTSTVTISNTSTSTSQGASSTQTIATTSSTTITCLSCVTTTAVGEGTPALVVSLAACPVAGCTSSSFVFNGAGITLTAMITNAATQTVNNVALVLSPATGIPTGTAYVAASGACSPASQSIGVGATVPVTCSFTGYTGSHGGSVTFVGYATGTVSGSQTTSAEATSNPVQIGNLFSAGPWSLNYFSYNFEASQQRTPASANYVSAGDDHVSWSMTLNNNFNQSLTILDETFVMNVRLGADPTFFIMKNAPDYTQTPPKITSYNCYPGSSSAGCITVPSGGSATIWLGSCPPSTSTSPGSTSWGWANSGGGGGCGQTWSPVEGDSVLLVVFYTLGSGTSGAVYSQSLPFQSEIITYSTSMTLSCSPNPVQVGSPSTCTGKVISSSGSISPTGTLTFTASPTSGTFSPVSATCTLSPISGTQASCTVTFTPSSPGPFTMSVSYPGDSLHGPASATTTLNTLATLPISCTMLNSAPSSTLTVSSNESTPSPATVACDGAVHNILVSSYSSVTVTEPAAGANVRYEFSGSLTSLSTTACGSGTCTTWAFNNYEQLQSTYKAAPNARSTFDVAQTITASGTQLGSAATICTMATTNGGAAVTCAGWADYNTAVALSPTSITVNSNDRWLTANPVSFTDTTGGNTHTVNYWDQLQNTYKAAPNGKSTFNVVQTITVSGNQIGSAATICTMATSSGGGATSCAGWADYNSAASFSPTSMTVSANERWSAATPTSFTDTTGGNTHTVNYWDQLQNTYRANPSAPTTFDAAYSIPVTGTMAGASGTTGCTITTSNGGGVASCQAWFDYNTLVTVTTPVTSGNERWLATGANTFTDTTGGNTRTVNYDRQQQNTYHAVPNGSSTWDLATSIPITGTQLGVSGSTVCTIATTNGGGTASCSGWSDYNTAASFSVTNVADGASERWLATGTTSFTDTTGGNTHSVNYWDQVQNTYKAAPNARATFDVAQTITISGNQLGAGATICTFATSNGGGAVSCTGYSDYGSTATYSPVTISVSGNERWYAANPVSFTDTTGGNTHTVNYYDQLQNTYKATPSSPATWDASYSIPVTGSVGGVTGTTGCTIVSATGGGAVTCAGWFDYNTLVTVTSPITAGSDRWTAGSNTFTQTTGGNTNNVAYSRGFGFDPNAASHSITYFASGTGASTVTLSTTNANDLIVACEYIVNTGPTLSISGGGLSWSAAVTSNQGNGHGQVACESATAATALGSVSISFSTGGSSSGGKVALIFAITGNSVALDGAIHLNSGHTTSPASVTFSTTAAPDMVFGAAFATGSTTFTAGGSYALVSSTTTGPSGAYEDLVATSTGSQTPSMTYSGTIYWIAMGVAIDPPASAPQPAAAASPITPLAGSIWSLPLLLGMIAQVRLSGPEQWGDIIELRKMDYLPILEIGNYGFDSIMAIYLLTGLRHESFASGA